MKALLPVFCRPLGYVILVISMFIPFLLLMQGMVTDSNLLFYKECIKLLMILGAMMIIFALSRNEGRETEIIRNKATRNAIFLTVLFLFGGMLYRVATGDIMTVDTSSFLIFLISMYSALNLVCKKRESIKSLKDNCV